MAWDGNGQFTRTNGTQSGAVTWADADAAGNDITTSQHDTHDEDLADGIGACLTKNGESKPTADFKPNADAQYSLGSAALKWVNLFLSGVINSAQGADIASATTLNLDNATGNVVDVTGTTTITGIALSQGRWRLVRFTGALTLTHGASLVLPGAANITTAAGDWALFIGGASSVVRCALYIVAANSPSGAVAATQTQMEAASSNAVVMTPGNAKWHPGVAKARCRWDADTTVLAGFGVSSITDTGTGDWTVNYSTSFSATNAYVPLFTTFDIGAVGFAGIGGGGLAVGSTRFVLRNAGGLTDGSGVNYMAAFGDQ